MKKLSFIWILLFVIGVADVMNAQFNSVFAEHQLNYGDQIKSDYHYALSRNSKPAKIQLLFPSVSASLFSPKIKYWDIYNRNRKSIDLVSASDSGKDFNLYTNMRFSYGGLIYNHERWSFSLMHEWTADAALDIPNHIFEFATQGNTNLANSSVEINPFAFFQTHHKWSVGIDRHFDQFKVGMQVHYVRGDALLNTNASSVQIDFEENFFELAFDKQINVQSSGALNYHELDSIDFILKDHAFSFLGSSQNSGLAVGAHFVYETENGFRVFGRLDDVGFVNWNKETSQLQDESLREFQGFDIRKSYVTGEQINVQDTINSFVNIIDDKSAFNSTLLSSFILGIRLPINDFLSAGGMIKIKNNAYQQLIFIEPQLTIQPIQNTFISISNIYYTSSPFNVKLSLNTEIYERFGVNMALINPWQFGKYYDSKMIHASMGFYLKL